MGDRFSTLSYRLNKVKDAFRVSCVSKDGCRGAAPVPGSADYSTNIPNMRKLVCKSYNVLVLIEHIGHEM